MGHKFAEIAFTDTVRRVQQDHGSRSNYAAMEEGDDYNFLLGDAEASFIAVRDSFYMASISETGWPYLQHRGGPAGFMRVLDEKTLGFADFSGNRQYVSTGNFMNNDRVALFFMDYPNRRRLKLLGRVRLVSLEETDLLEQLEDANYRARVERGFVIHVEAFDWNCPQHITPRYTEAYIEDLTAPLLEENGKLKSYQHGSGRALLQTLGEGPLDLVISGIRQLTPSIRAYELRDPGGSDLPLFEAGAHIQVPVQLDGGEVTLRHYSITSDPARRDRYEIAVLREDSGRGGSSAVHDQYQIGMTLRCELPQNYFSLHEGQSPAVLIAGGIGITPIKSMASALNRRNADLHLHYAGRSYPDMAFRDRLERDLGDRLTAYSSANGERIDIQRVLESAAGDAIFYVCGPSRLIDAVTDVAETLGIDGERIRFERFTATVDPDAKPIELELRRSGKKIQVNADQTILDAMLDAGIDAPYSCRAGNCKTCAVKVLDGNPDHRDSALSDRERDEQQLMCPCISRADSGYLALDI
jgi:ferredoxin-NADP reductase/predicted pyridoxine 5'-phosphate oxidase superfamily flavin-nucleotide-binding protein